MDRAAITKAQSRLRVVKKSIRDLSFCKDYDSFRDSWYMFLTAAKNIYTVLEQGAKASAACRQWYGMKADERRSDPLLQYTYQARNDDEHGLAPGSVFVEGYFAAGSGGGENYCNSMMINTNPDGSLRFDSLDGKPILFQQSNPHVRLIEVHDRNKKPYPPPEQHLGKPVNGTVPIIVAQLMADYLEKLINEAEGLA